MVANDPMSTLSLSDLDRDTLDAMRIAILTELERRDLIEKIPDQLSEMTRAAITCGVSADNIRSTIESALSEK